MSDGLENLSDDELAKMVADRQQRGAAPAAQAIQPAPQDNLDSLSDDRFHATST
jgi:hypothetical protein